MVFGNRFDDRVQEVAWPDSVVRLELLGVVFEQEIDGVQWPALLQELTVLSTMRWGEERGRAL